MQTSPITRPPQSRGKTITNSTRRHSSAFRPISRPIFRAILAQIVDACDVTSLAQDSCDRRRDREDLLAVVEQARRGCKSSRVNSTNWGGRKVKPSLSSRRDVVSCGKCPLTRDTLYVRAACARGPICDFRRFCVHATVLPEQISSPSSLSARQRSRSLVAVLTRGCEIDRARRGRVKTERCSSLGGR